MSTLKETPEQKAARIAAFTPEERAAYDKKLETLARARAAKQANQIGEKTPEIESRRRYYY